jgi:hypothetical protein
MNSTLAASKAARTSSIVEVIEHYHIKHGEASWEECLALTALTGIKADLLRFGVNSALQAEPD